MTEHEKEKLFIATLEANTALTTCKCYFPANPNTLYTYIIPVKTAERAEPGDLVIVDHNSNHHLHLVTIQSIDTIPDYRWGSKTRTVLSLNSRRKIEQSAELCADLKEAAFNIALEHVEKKAQRRNKKFQKKLQKALGLQDLFN